MIIVVLSLLTMQVAHAALPGPYEPYRLALDNDGNIYALAAGNESVGNFIHVYAFDGREIKTISEGNIRRVDEIAFDLEGNLYLRDYATLTNETLTTSIRKIDKNGNESIISYVNKSDQRVINAFAVRQDGAVYFNQWSQEYDESATDREALYESLVLKVELSGTISVAYAENQS